MANSTWRQVKLEEIKANIRYSLNGGPFGSNLVRTDYMPTGIPIIRGTNIREGTKFSFDDLVFVSEEKADELLANNAHPGDLIFTQRGTLGQVGLIPRTSPYNRFVISQSQMKLTVDKSQVDAYFLYCYFRAPTTIQMIQNLAFSSGVPHINLDILRKFEVSLPPLPTQQKIAAILSAYDDLIENNTRRIKILEEMAQTIYREWFVNFHFTGHDGVRVWESELGTLPEGWEIRNLFDIADVTYGFPFKSNIFTSEPTDKPVIRIRNILNDHTDNFTTESVSEKYLVKNGDLLVGMDGDFHMGKWAGGIAYLNQRVVRFRPKEKLSPYYLYLALEKPIQYFDSTITGTTVAHLSDRDLKSIRLLIPDITLLKKANETFNPLFNLEIMLKIKNTNLRRSRDLLLQKLISGELDVSGVNIRILKAEI